VPEAYLDIETTGLSSFNNYITVIGLYLVNGRRAKMVQLIGRDVTRQNLLEALEGISTIFTYNGRRFDLPFIRDYLDIDLSEHYQHHDLMYDCWRCNLYGGFKNVEAQLGIPRKLKGIGGLEAVTLWWQYQNYGDRRALSRLVRYNQEDVINLKELRERLPVDES